MKESYVYVACPYSHHDEVIMEERYKAALTHTYKLIKQGIPTYSPIVHNHPIALVGGLPRTWEFWKKIDIPMLLPAQELHVLKLEGWEESVGVSEEIQIAKASSIMVYYIKPESYL